MKELRYYANLAKKILEKDTKYLDNKKLISRIFNTARSPLNIAIYLSKKIIGTKDSLLRSVIHRLTVIDSYYSTQMTKRLFGIEEVADKIISISDDDYKLGSRFRRSILNSYADIEDLFQDKYGIDKSGANSKAAQSIVSKYAYFLTNYRFPIYDSFARESYDLISRLYPKYNLVDLERTFDFSYFSKIYELNVISGINDLDKLDNLLWLCGKIRNGSLALVLKREEYGELVKHIDFSDCKKSKDYDKKIVAYLQKSIDSRKLTQIFSNDTLEFMRFCFREKVTAFKFCIREERC